MDVSNPLSSPPPIFPAEDHPPPSQTQQWREVVEELFDMNFLEFDISSMELLETIGSTSTREDIEKVPEPFNYVVTEMQPPAVHTNNSTNESGNTENLICNGKISKSSYHGKKLDPEGNSQKKWVPWTEKEHRLFLLGLKEFGKGEWRSISKFVETRSPTQVSSHAQKYFLRRDNPGSHSARKSSVFDIHTVDDSIKPKPKKLRFRPIAPSPLPPPPPIIPTIIDFTSWERTSVPNQSCSSIQRPMESFRFEIEQSLTPQQLSGFGRECVNNYPLSGWNSDSSSQILFNEPYFLPQIPNPFLSANNLPQI